MKDRKLSDINLVNEYKGTPKNRCFLIGTKIYKILGFDIEVSPVDVYAQRLLRKTMKPSSKQPIFEVFKFEDTQNQQIRLCQHI